MVRGMGIVVLSIAMAVVYGIAHDQVTARVCVEYFTIGHPPVWDSTDPTELAIVWGIIATWWVGLILGVPLAVVARVGSRPKRSVSSLVPPILWLMGVMATCALAAGVIGGLLASSGAVFLVQPMATLVPADRHVPFLICLWAHSASYLVGAVGGAALVVRIWRSRGRAEAARSP